MIFLIWPEETAFSCSWYHISAQSLWDGCLLLSLLRQADGAAVCQFMWCVHMSQSRWTLRQNRDLSPKPSSKSISFLLQSSFYWFHKEVKIKGFWLKQSRLHHRTSMKWWRIPWKDSKMNHEPYCLNLPDFGMPIPLCLTCRQKENWMNISREYDSPCTLSSHFPGLHGANDQDWGAKDMAGEMRTNIYLFSTRRN